MIELLQNWALAIGAAVLVSSMALNFLYKRLWWQIVVGTFIHLCAMVWWIGPGEEGAVILFSLIYFVTFAAFGIPAAVYAIRLPRFIWSLNGEASEANKQR